MKLTPRLQAIADLIPAGARVADIGTDHGYIPVYLLSNRLATRVIASDSRSGPLKAAAETLKLFNLSHSADLRLGDGLEVLDPLDQVDAVVIAGLGGETACSILERGKDVLSQDTHLILQPMTEPGLVRVWLADNGWEIINEDIAQEDNFFYEVIVAVPGRADIPDRRILEIGPILFAKKHPLLKELLELRLGRLEKAAACASSSRSDLGMSRAELLQNRAEYLREVLSCL